jgi:hypothetical protein
MLVGGVIVAKAAFDVKLERFPTEKHNTAELTDKLIGSGQR